MKGLNSYFLNGKRLLKIGASSKGFKSVSDAAAIAFSNEMIGHPLTRYDVVPVTLYRFHTSSGIKLRSYEQRVAAGATGDFAYDIHEADGLVHPMSGDTFSKPNGMSLRPKCDMQKIFAMENTSDKLRAFVLPEGLKVPPKLVLLHEHSNHYSMQPREPMTLVDLNRELTSLLKSLEYLSKEKFLNLFEEKEEATEAFNN